MKPRIPLVSIHGLMRSLIHRWDRNYFEEGVLLGCTGQNRTRLETVDSAFETLRAVALRGKLRGWHNGIPLDHEFWREAQVDLLELHNIRINGFDMSGAMFHADDVKAAFFPPAKMPDVIYPSLWSRLMGGLLVRN
jgi:hypothetical protein